MRKFFSEKQINCLLLTVIILVAFTLRLYGINWDQNQHLHPDERFLTMVTVAIKWPTSVWTYLNPQLSTLNPYNLGFGFFVYGTFPLVITKYFSQFISLEITDYNNIALVGRLLSTIFDVGTLLMVYKIAKKIFDQKTGIIASFLYSISVLPIQLSHFFAVDTFLVFFIVLTFYALYNIIEGKNPIKYSVILGITLGLGIAAKITALLTLPFILISILHVLIKTKNKSLICLSFLLFTIFLYITLRIADPRIFVGDRFFSFNINPVFIQNLKSLKSYDDQNTTFPPAIQWITTKPLIFPLKNIILWGLGLPLGLLSVIAVLYSFYQSVQYNINFLVTKKLKFLHLIKPQDFFIILILAWILSVFTYQGVQYTKTMRYFYPIYPFLAIFASNFICKMQSHLSDKIKNKTLLTLFYSSTLLLFLIWPLSFIHIYSTSHSRVSASEWIYQKIPPGSTISCEYWDDCLPLNLKNKYPGIYRTETLEMFNPDSAEKWQKLEAQLQRVDYLILSSNRVWGSIPKVPEKYPLTSKFYNDLFADNLNFKKVVEFTSYPGLEIGNWKLEIPDEVAEEAFTVYDHPKVMIFKKNFPLEK